MMMCMCGDYCCRSCGPAQGNYRCPNCGIWDSDGGCQTPLACGLKEVMNSYFEYMWYLLGETPTTAWSKEDRRKLIAYSIIFDRPVYHPNQQDRIEYK